MTEHLRLETSRGHVGVRSFGEGDPPVVLLHGVPGSARSWGEVAERLRRRNRVVVPDLLGFGSSTRSADIDVLHAVGQAGVVEEVCDHLGLDRAVLVGHDFGGPVALTLARRRPELVHGLGLLAANAFGDTPIPFPLSLTTWPWLGSPAARVLFSRPSLRSMIRAGVGAPSTQIDMDAAIGDRRQARAIGLIFQTSLTRLADLYGPLEEGLGSIDVPTLVGWGERDPFFSVDQGRRTAAAIPGARFHLYGGAGHFLPEERPGEVARDLAQLASLAGTRS